MSKLSISNVIQVTMLAALKGLANVNTSALAMITDEEPISSTYGDYGIYKETNSIANDFGSNSKTYALGLMVFGQNPNILSGGGFLVIIPRKQDADAQPATIFSINNVDLTKLTAPDYILRAIVNSAASQEIVIGELDLTNMETIVTSLNNAAITAAGLVFSLSGEITSAKITLQTIGTGSAKNITLGIPTTSDTGTDICPVLNLPEGFTVNGTEAGLESAKDCIIRTSLLVPYFGIIYTNMFSDPITEELAGIVQTMDKIQFIGSENISDIVGIFKNIKDAGYTHTRCLMYSISETDAISYAAGYASRFLCVDFDAPNTVLTMNLKEIIGLVADTGITQTILDSAKNNGVDVYVDFGILKIITSGANGWSDDIYVSLALKLRLQIAGFNFLATTNTKRPQTEDGMNGLKGAYRKVCALFVKNGSFAPGTWNDPTTFGKPEDHIRNISDFGYFIYSDPIALQSQESRKARIAPAVQIACKLSGALHTSSVIVYVEN